MSVDVVLTKKAAKLMKIMEHSGFDHIDTLLAVAAHDGITLGVCMNPRCDFTAQVEPDQRGGYCEWCEDNTVQSALVLADLI